MSIGNLQLAAVPVLEGEEYQPPADFKPIPDDGEYTLKLHDTYPDEAFEEDKRKDEPAPWPLQVMIDPTVVGDRDGNPSEFNGSVLKWQRASTRFLKYRKSSDIADLLMALDLDPHDLEGLGGLEAVEYLREHLSGAEFPAYIRWESSFLPKQGGKRVYVKGQPAHDAANLRKLGIPLDKEAVGYQARYPSPWEKDKADATQPKLIFVNARIGRYIMPAFEEE